MLFPGDRAFFYRSGTPEYIANRWNDLLRITGSMKQGYVTASLFIDKLQSYLRQNNLTYVLQEYGRLVKTVFIFRYLVSQSLRRKINTQLNKRETLHALRNFHWFGGDGKIRKKEVLRVFLDEGLFYYDI